MAQFASVWEVLQERPDAAGKYLHTDLYHLFRHVNFEMRNPGRSAPNYYLDYGDRYMRRFLDNTKKDLSAAGQRWFDRTLKGLQDAIEEKLMSNDPQNYLIEEDANAFKKFAFASHAGVYIGSGLLGLPILDKVRIALTPDASDLFSPEGLDLVRTVGKEQLKYYKKHKIFAAGQAWELVFNSIEIYNLVSQYAHKNAVDYSQIWKLVKAWLGQ